MLLEVTLARMGELEECGQARVFAAVDLIGDERDEVLARADEFGELGFARGRSGIRARLEAWSRDKRSGRRTQSRGGCGAVMRSAPWFRRLQR